REPAATEPTNAVDPPNGRTRVPAGPTPTGAKPAGMLGGEPSVPPDVRLVPVTDSVGVGLLVRVHREAFGRVHPALGAALLARLGGRVGCPAARRGRGVGRRWGRGRAPGRCARAGGSPTAAPSSRACGAAAPCRTGAAAACSGRWSRTGPRWPPPAASVTCRW